MKIDPPSTTRRCSSASDSWSETSPSTLKRAIMLFLIIFERLPSYSEPFSATFERVVERQMRVVGTTSSIGSLRIESIFASPGPAPTQHPASSLRIGIIIGIDRSSKY